MWLRFWLSLFKAKQGTLRSSRSLFLTRRGCVYRIVVPPAGYLTEVRQLCTKHNVLLICDEIQTVWVVFGLSVLVDRRDGYIGLVQDWQDAMLRARRN